MQKDIPRIRDKDNVVKITGRLPKSVKKTSLNFISSSTGSIISILFALFLVFKWEGLLSSEISIAYCNKKNR